MKEVSRVVVLKKGDKAVENQLFSLYCEPVEMAHNDRLVYITQLVKNPPTKAALWKRAKRHGWEAELKEAQSGGIKKLQPPTQATEQEPTAVIEPQGTSFAVIGATVKEFGYRALSVSGMMVNTICMVIEAEAQDLQVLLMTEKLRKLTLTELTKKRTLIDSISDKEKQMREYLKPSSVAQYLRLSGMEAALANSVEGIDKEAFTPQALLEALEGMVKAKAVADTIDPSSNSAAPLKGLTDLGAEQEALQSEHGIVLPVVDATKVKDTANDGTDEQSADLLNYRSKFFADNQGIA